MANHLKPEKRARLEVALADGLGTRTAAKVAGCSHITVLRYIKVLAVPRGLCGCGKAASHNGWCPWRYQNSALRQAFIASWSKPGKIRRALVEQNVGLVGRCASMVLSGYTTIDRDDLMSAGYVGLVEAARTFDAKRGASFATHAWKRIHGSMLDAKRRQAHERGYVRRTGKSWRQKVSFAQPAISEDGEEMPIVDDSADDVDGRILTEQRIVILKSLPLDKRSRVILEGKLSGLTNRQIGAKLRVSEGRVSQLWDRLQPKLMEMVQAARLERATHRLKTGCSAIELRLPWSDAPDLNQHYSGFKPDASA